MLTLAPGYVREEQWGAGRPHPHPTGHHGLQPPCTWTLPHLALTGLGDGCHHSHYTDRETEAAGDEVTRSSCTVHKEQIWAPQRVWTTPSPVSHAGPCEGSRGVAPRVCHAAQAAGASGKSGGKKVPEHRDVWGEKHCFPYGLLIVSICFCRGNLSGRACGEAVPSPVLLTTGSMFAKNKEASGSFSSWGS